MIACGNSHTVFITTNKDAYSVGKNSSGQLGLSQVGRRNYACLIEYLSQYKDRRGNFKPKKIIQVACACKSTYFLTENKKVYSCGNNSYGELGYGVTAKKSNTSPKLVSFFQKTIQIAAGYYHVCFLGEKGNVKSCGSNDYGQLGIGDKTQVSTPIVVETLKEEFIIQISCGSHHSLFLTKEAVVYSTGYNKNGQLGIGCSRNSRIPQKITSLPSNIVSIAAGNVHSMFLTQKRQLFACGFNGYGELGVGKKNVRSEYEPKKVKFKGKIETLISTPFHCNSFFITTDKKVYGFGMNQSGQLGLGNKTNRYEPTHIKVDGNKIVWVASGEKHTVFLTDKGVCYSTGANRNDQLGHGDSRNKVKPVKILKLPKIMLPSQSIVSFIEVEEEQEKKVVEKPQKKVDRRMKKPIPSSRPFRRDVEEEQRNKKEIQKGEKEKIEKKKIKRIFFSQKPKRNIFSKKTKKIVKRNIIYEKPKRKLPTRKIPKRTLPNPKRTLPKPKKQEKPIEKKTEKQEEQEGEYEEMEYYGEEEGEAEYCYKEGEGEVDYYEEGEGEVDYYEEGEGEVDYYEEGEGEEYYEGEGEEYYDEEEGEYCS